MLRKLSWPSSVTGHETSLSGTARCGGRVLDVINDHQERGGRRTDRTARPGAGLAVRERSGRVIPARVTWWLSVKLRRLCATGKVVAQSCRNLCSRLETQGESPNSGIFYRQSSEATLESL